MKYWLFGVKIQQLCIIITLSVVQICFSASANSQDFSFSNAKKKSSLSFDLAKNLIIVPVYLNEKGPFNFILDTGVASMIITDSTIRDGFNLNSLRKIKISGFGDGDDIEAFAVNQNVKIGDAIATGLSGILLKEDIFNLSNYVGKNISGLIGYDFFFSFVVKINYINRKIKYYLPQQVKPIKIKGEKIPIELIEKKPYINAEIDNEDLGKRTVKLIVDCGASHALSLETWQRNAFPVPNPHIQGNLGIGLSGLISGQIGRIAQLNIGSFQFKNVLTNFPQYSQVAAKANIKDRNGNLGAEILKRFHVVYDYANHAMYLQKNELFKAPFEHDMSGMELYVLNKPINSYLVSRIEPDSPAEKAGFKINDQIIGINFKEVREYSFDELNNMLKANDGRTIIVEIVRAERTSIKLLRLKKRI